MDSARERFGRWVTWSGLTDAEVARRLGCDVSYPGKLRRVGYDKRPGLDVAHAIERISAAPRDDGKTWKEPAIRTEEWLDPPKKMVARPTRRRRRAAAEKAA
jgi:hypothetical protein